MSSRYCRHPEYEPNAEVTNASARSTPSPAILRDRVGQERVPVTVSPVDRQVRAGARELGADRGQQGATLVVDGAAPAEVLVVRGHLAQPLRRDFPSTQHPLEERHDVVAALGPSEGHEQQRVVAGRHGLMLTQGGVPPRGLWLCDTGTLSRSHDRALPHREPRLAPASVRSGPPAPPDPGLPGRLANDC